MSNYSIEKKGADFVVKFGQQDILKFSTRRLAAAMVKEAKAIRAMPAAPAAVKISTPEM